MSPAEPVATAIAPAEVAPTDFHMVRAPEFGDAVERSPHVDVFAAAPTAGGLGGKGGTGGSPPSGGRPNAGGGIFR